MNILNDIVNYAIKNKLIEKKDSIFVLNRLAYLLKVENPYSINTKYERAKNKNDIDSVLNTLINLAYDNKVIESTDIVLTDILDTEIMAILTPMPSVVQNNFDTLSKKSIQNATDYFYDLSIKSNYVRMNRIKKNIEWKAKTKAGHLIITINLSKPEKDPKAIALQKNIKETGYPTCMLCKENEGFYGTYKHPARGNLRTIDLKLGGEKWFLQYSPYIYYKEHSIIFSQSHRPMKIDTKTFSNLLEFLEKFNHYFIGSNTDIPIVGGSILTHDHYQAGRFVFPLDKASVLKTFNYNKKLSINIINWPLNILRLISKDKNEIINMSEKILKYWKKYNNKSLNIFSKTDNTPHNAITPIARRKGDYFEMDLVLRNNITTSENPLGVFHPHSDKHHIKKENIGLIEVMGLAILPARLLDEIDLVKKYLLNDNIEEAKKNKLCSKHIPWMLKMKSKYKIDEDNLDSIIKNEIGLIFYDVLKDCGVFKENNDFIFFTSEMIEKINRKA